MEVNKGLETDITKRKKTGTTINCRWHYISTERSKQHKEKNGGELMGKTWRSEIRDRDYVSPWLKCWGFRTVQFLITRLIRVSETFPIRINVYP